LVSVGRIVRSHDKWGEVKVRLFDLDRLDLAGVGSIIIRKGERTEELSIESARPQGRDLILKLAGVDSLSGADALAGLEVMVEERALARLESGRFYVFELVGCRLVTPAGDEVGLVTDVIVLGENSLLAVDRQGREVLIPFHESICREIRLADKVITVELPPGLLEINES
jgi:16S rRNA processing protein RimM